MVAYFFMITLINLVVLIPRRGVTMFAFYLFNKNKINTLIMKINVFIT